MTRLREAASTGQFLLVAAGIVLGWCGTARCLTPSGDASAPPTSYFAKQCIPEPVFGDTACVYDVNPAAARTVVLVHGINGRAENWDLAIPVLAKRFHVVAVDLPGFGQSTHANRLYSVANYASFLNFVVTRYTKPPVDLIGHSLGAAVALWYASEHPADVSHLILVDAAGVLHRLSLAKLAANRWLGDVLGDFQKPGGFLGRWMGRTLGRVGDLPVDPGIVLSTAMTRQRVLGGDPARIAAFALAQTDFSNAIPRVSAPTLVVWGDNDEIASIRAGEVLAIRLANARLVTLPAGHDSMRDQPERFLELALAHLDGEDVPATWPTRAIPPAGAEGISARCDHVRGATYEGAFDVLEINGCTDVAVNNARIKRLEITDSNVAITHSIIEGGDVGAKLVNADLTATAVDLSGDVAISADNSTLDLAGVHIEGLSAAVIAPQPSGVIFSVSRVESPHALGTAHEALKVSPESPI